MLIRRAAPGDYETVGELTEAAYEDFLEGPDDYYRTWPVPMDETEATYYLRSAKCRLQGCIAMRIASSVGIANASS